MPDATYPEVALWVAISDTREAIPAFSSAAAGRAWIAATSGDGVLIGLDAHREERIRIELHRAHGTRSAWERVRRSPERSSLYDPSLN